MVTSTVTYEYPRTWREVPVSINLNESVPWALLAKYRKDGPSTVRLPVIG